MIGTVSTDEKAAAARANGCAHVIVTSRENTVARVMEITGGKGVPVVCDSVGKDTPWIRWTACGCAAGRLQRHLVGLGGGGLPVAGRQGFDLDDAARDGALHPAARPHAGDGASCSTMLAGRIASEPQQSFALADAAQAHRALEVAAPRARRC
ncbi:Prostaglandin reductase 3 [Manis javanica]|nr:Prostaglandin reductase 3 [Manis javanica]